MKSSRSRPRDIYKSEIDKIDEKDWNELIAQFSDASMHQTWSSGIVRRGINNLGHLVLRNNKQVIGAAQVTIRKLPFLSVGVADVLYGPLWRKKERSPEIQDFTVMIRALKEEYAVRRGLVLRVWPNEFEGQENTLRKILQDMEFHADLTVPTKRTLVINLAYSLEVLRKNLSKTWRLHLNRAEKSKLQIVEGTSDDLYGIFLAMLKEMVARKRFIPRVDYDQYRIIQRKLPENLKMRILACYLEGRPVCTIVCSTIGNTGVYLFGATGNEGLKTNASNLLHWKMIQYYKEKGYGWYDLGGINPEKNPGTYQFKRGLAGALGEDRTQIGRFYFYRNSKSRFVGALSNSIISCSGMRMRTRNLRIGGV